MSVIASAIMKLIVTNGPINSACQSLPLQFDSCY